MLRSLARQRMRLVSCACLAICAAVVLCSGATVRGHEQGAPLENFRIWLDLARDHTPEEVDGPIREVRAYSLNRLAELQGDLNAFIEFLKDPDLTRLQRTQRYTQAEQITLRNIAAAERTAGTAPRLLRRIALLHSDAVMLKGAVPYVFGGQSATPPDVILGVDGVSMGAARTPPHLPIARAALSGLPRGPAQDPWARLWYRAIAAYLLYDARLASFPAHLQDWRLAIDDDAAATFAEACLYETYAGDRIQRTVEAERARGGTAKVPDTKAALTRARTLFGRLAPADADYQEARVRLGRILLRLGDARAAADELALRLDARDPDVRYLAYLFLGVAQWALGDTAAAVRAYEEALRLFPAAQSPAVALLLVRPATSDLDSAAISVLKGAASDRADPWFDYDAGPGRHVHALLSAVWRSVDTR